MNTLTIFQIALEFWGILLCIVSCISIALSTPYSRTSRKFKLLMQLCCVLLLCSDMTAYIFRGQKGTLAFYMVHISNFLVFFINFIYMALFSHYLWRTIDIKISRTPKRLVITCLLSGLGILLLIISQFTGIFYYIDSLNVYHRGPVYIVSQLLAFAAIILNFTLLLQYRRQLNRAVFYAISSFFILPLLSTIALIFFYGLALQNIALVLSTQIMFAVDMIDVSMRLQKTENAFAKAHFDAQHDAMTGLYNKTSGMKKMKYYIENMQPEDKASLLFVDIDDFKGINDTLGHSSGDYWIIEIGNLLHALCTHDDILCRFGGDEYTILLTNVSTISALKQKVETFTKCLQEKAAAENVNIHCSVGICIIQGSGHHFEESVELADTALYEAKAKGKNTFSIQFLEKHL